ncbi:alpha/beta fold hydrolase [Leclercia adecarboxylata]|uniref:alpha/beta fold hydrolase n=1 Tax=Leclercia adecarboxylata TaxID=83655 RepID=UPI00384D8610
MPTENIRAMIGGSLLLMSVLVPASAAQSLSEGSEQPNSQRISVQTEGSGTDVILIPELASSRDVWADLASGLRMSHRIHLIELAGFASTLAISNPEGEVIAPAVDAVAEYIHTQHIKTPVIIDHSLGGRSH